MTRCNVQRLFRFGVLLLTGSGCLAGNRLMDTSGSAGSSGTGMLPAALTCTADPDGGGNCDFWTCANVPTQYAHKTHCTRTPPPPGTPPGSYACAPNARGEICPRPDLHGGGSWECVAGMQQLSCVRDNTASGGGAAIGGLGTINWECVIGADGTQTCRNPTCISQAGEIHCMKTVTTTPPGIGWQCQADVDGHPVCMANPNNSAGGSGFTGGGGYSGFGGFAGFPGGGAGFPGGGAGFPGGGAGFPGGSAGFPGGGAGFPGGGAGFPGTPPGGGYNTGQPPLFQNCPFLGQRRWCDGLMYCGFGTQTCVQDLGGLSWNWGPCSEQAAGGIPPTICACEQILFHRGQFNTNPRCFDDPSGQRLVINIMPSRLCGVALAQARQQGVIRTLSSEPGAFGITCDGDRDCGHGEVCARLEAGSVCAKPSVGSLRLCPKGTRRVVPSESPIPVCAPTDDSLTQSQY
jgi:hypothetical protein